MGFLRRPLVVRARLLSTVRRIRRLWLLSALVLVPPLLSSVLPRTSSGAGLPRCSTPADQCVPDAPYAQSRGLDSSNSATNHASAEATDDGHLPGSHGNDAHRDDPAYWYRPDDYGNRPPVTPLSWHGEPTPPEPHAHAKRTALLDSFVEGNKRTHALGTLVGDEQEQGLESAFDRRVQQGPERQARPQPLGRVLPDYSTPVRSNVNIWVHESEAGRRNAYAARFAQRKSGRRARGTRH